MRGLRSLAVVGVGSVIVLLGLAAPASAAASRGALTVSSSTVAIGDTVTVSGGNCIPGPSTEVDVAFGDEDPVAATPGDDGSWSVDFTADTAGTIKITATCDDYTGSGSYDPATVTVNGAASGSLGTPSRAGCQVTIPATVTAGSYELRVYDDGAVVDSITFDATKKVTQNVTWLITRPAGTSAPGVGFYLFDADGNQLDGVDPWEYPAAVADGCSTAGKTTISLGTTTPITPGSTLHVTAAGFWPDEPVTITMHSTPVTLLTTTADDTGAVSAEVVIPSAAALGAHVLSISGQLSGFSVEAPFTVVAAVESTENPPVTTPTTPGLAATGVNTLGMSLWGVGFLVVGGLAMAVSRRGRGRHASGADGS